MIIIAGPSTVGKNPFIYHACELYNLEYVIPYTTRGRRSDEIEGKDYFFLTKEAFQVDIKSKKITEWDFCLNNYYGFSHDTLQGTRVITHALSRMAIRIKEKNPQEVTTIFLMPQNKDKIFSNLNQIYKGDDLLLRKALVEEEICHSVLFDEIITVSDSAIELLYDESVKKIILNTK